jgi:hypothetical protein
MKNPLTNSWRKALLTLVALAFAGSINAQTITWTAATNPHVVSGTYVVPAGQTLVMEPGVIVNIQSNSKLQVDGQLIGNGTAASRIQITSAWGPQSSLDVRGTADLKFTDIHTLVIPNTNGVLLFADCRFLPGGGYVYNGSILQQADSRAPYLQFDRCAFQGDTTTTSASLYVIYATVVVRNTSFTNGSFFNVPSGYLFVDNVTSDHSSEAGMTLGSDSDLFLNNITVTNAAHEGLRLDGDTRNGTNVLIGSNVTLQNNEYPIHLTIAGLYPASVIPSTGNLKNQIHASQFAGVHGLWPKFAIPYYVDGSPLTVGNGLHISPGVLVKMAPFSYINDIGFGDGVRAFGTKAEPIIFERADPAQGWYDLHADRTEGGRLRHTIVRGNTDGVNGGRWRLENCIIQSNGIGTSGGALVSGTQYLSNTIGQNAGDAGSVNGGTNPNSFEGNGTGVNYSPDARNSWWGSPTGPMVSSNPGGTGDRIGSVQTPYQPFLTSRPDYNDAPPEVVLMRPAFQVLRGSKITLRWSSTDDVGVVSHKILYSLIGNLPSSFQTIATLPGNQHTYEFTVPGGSTSNPFVKVVAVDTTGKESFDEWEVVVPTNDIAGNVTFNISAGETMLAGQMREPIYTKEGIDPYLTEVEFYLEEVKGETRKMFGRGRGGVPFQSSDTMRFVVAFGDTGDHRKYWYSPFFKIRPDSRLNDAPPTIALVSPAAGSSFAPGGVVPVSWTASDDEGLRAFDIVASYDAGRTWNPIARGLPGSARSFDWDTAPGSGYGDVRLMVIARDWRFQSSSDGATRSFSISGSGPAVPGSVVSRKAHGTAGTFDINLPLSGNAGIESRSGGANNDYQVVFNFPSAVTVGGATVTPEAGKTGAMVGGPSVSADGKTVTLNLTNVSDVQTLTVTLNGVSNGSGSTNIAVRMSVIVGDANGNGAVTASDIGLTKAQSGQAVTSANFRADVVANGNINASDLALVKSRSGGGSGEPITTRN